jgi:fatty-acyl-CoA synthase
MLDLRLHARAAPGRTAIVCDGAHDARDARLSYGELEALANRLAGVFRRLGLSRGDHVATLLANRPEGLAAAWAAWRSGLYLTPMSTALAPAELAYLVEDSDAKAVLIDASLGELACALPRAIARPVHWLSRGGDVAGFTALEPLLDAASPLPHTDEPPGALMMYTSGTTGAPKGVIRPLLPREWRGTPPFAADLIELFQVGGTDVRYLSTAPLYHAAPLRVALAVTAGGGTVFVMDRFDADQALRLIEREKITHSQWVPAMFQRLLALPGERRAAFSAPSHRIAIHGAAPCPIAVKRAMIDWWGPILLEYYSGTEGVGLTLIDSAQALRKPGSVGQARKGVVHIVDANGAELPPGHIGVVYFSGVAPFAYYKSPEKTRGKTLASGWQTFGDVGYLDEEGWLFLTDRLDDMIISGGVNLYPQEIEAAMLECPGVWECSVVGVPDERFGERPVAFVVAARDAISDAAPNAAPDAATLLERLRAHNRERLGKLKQPDAIHLIDQLPRTPTGKVLRRELRDMARRNLPR